MSTEDTGAEQPQGNDIEERVAKATAPQEEPAAPAPVPSANEEEQSSVDSSQAEEPSDEEAAALQQAKNPERTRQYIEKLKSELAAERQKQRQPQSQSVFDEYRAPQPAIDAAGYAGLNQQQVDSIASHYIDAEGNVDVDGLNRTLQEANQRAIQAQQYAQQAVERVTRYEESRQLQEAYQTYPQLDPQDKKFDPTFYEMVSQKLMVENYAKNKSLTVKQAADYIGKFYRQPETNIEKVKEQAVEEYKQAQAKRNQGPVERGKGEVRQSVSDQDDLRQRSRRGDARAIAERIDALTSK